MNTFLPLDDGGGELCFIVKNLLFNYVKHIL